MIKDCDLQVNLDPPEDIPIHCPICGDEAEDLYLDGYGDVCGCDKCMRRVEAYKWQGDKE